MRIRSSEPEWEGPRAHEVVAATAPKGNYRAAVVGCGRMGSTIDDEHVGKPHYPWPWAHAPGIIEARNVELVAGVDVDPKRLAHFGQRWGVQGPLRRPARDGGQRATRYRLRHHQARRAR